MMTAPMDTQHSDASSLESPANIGASVVVPLIMKREIRATALKKSMIITFIIAILLVVVGVLVASIVKDKADESGTQPETQKTSAVAIVGDIVPTDSEVSAQFGLEYLQADSEDTARDLLDSGDAAAALILVDVNGQPDHWRLLVDDTSSPVISLLNNAHEQTVFNSVARTAGLEPEIFDQARASAADDIVVESTSSIEQMSEARFIKVLVVLATMSVLLFAVLTFGGTTALSVVEEKSSRVVEIILATTRPLHLLTGKILGTGVVGLGFAAAVTAAGLLTAIVTGLLDVSQVPWSSIGIMLIAFILGYLFFTCLFALAGSLVSRTEDLSGTNLPIVFLAMAVFYSAFFGFAHLDTTLMRWLTYIPPFSTAVAPLQYAAGNIGPVGVTVAFLVLAVACAGVVVFVSTVYPRVILRMGQRVKLREVFQRS